MFNVCHVATHQMNAYTWHVASFQWRKTCHIFNQSFDPKAKEGLIWKAQFGPLDGFP
jgi:hypothetical protein